MTLVVLDTNAAVHAHQMGALQWPPIPIVAQLLVKGMRFVTTPAARGEMSAAVEHVVAVWQGEGYLRVQQVKRQQVRELENLTRRPKPGPVDLGLIALARGSQAALLTHDAPAQHFALDRAVGVRVVDLLDVIGWASNGGLVDLEALSDAWGERPHPSWRIAGWEGSVAATLAARRP